MNPSNYKLEAYICAHLLHSFQSKEPSRHSCNKPPTKINKKTIPPNITSYNMLLTIIIGIGIIKAISISKTKKITASKKNRVEKGIRDEFLGSNPHSKGDLFSRSINLRIDIKVPNTKIKLEINIAKNLQKIINNIHKKYKHIFKSLKG